MLFLAKNSVTLALAMQLINVHFYSTYISNMLLQSLIILTTYIETSTTNRTKLTVNLLSNVSMVSTVVNKM